MTKVFQPFTKNNLKFSIPSILKKFITQLKINENRTAYISLHCWPYVIIFAATCYFILPITPPDHLISELYYFRLYGALFLSGAAAIKKIYTYNMEWEKKNFIELST